MQTSFPQTQNVKHYDAQIVSILQLTLPMSFSTIPRTVQKNVERVFISSTLVFLHIKFLNKNTKVTHVTY